MKPETWDPLHSESSPELHWTTANLGEAMPGVLTPLSWTTWAYAVEHAPRAAAYALGALKRKESTVPADPADWFIRPFYGRPAMQVEFLATLGDRMPGTTGPKTVGDFFGEIPDDLAFHPTRRRLPTIAVRFPYVFATVPRRITRTAAEVERWYYAEIDAVPQRDLKAALAGYRDALSRLDHTIGVQTLANFAVMQPLFTALGALIARSGVGEPGILGGSGGAEMAVISDIWRVSRHELSIEAATRNHGFHGPLEGELSSRVWREDNAPLKRLADEYANKPDSQDPRIGERERQQRAAAMKADVLSHVPARDRLAARATLKLAGDRLPLRGVVKRSFLQCFDMARANARRAGQLLTIEGVLSSADDVVYLTASELAGPYPPDIDDLVVRRRARREHYTSVRLPGAWTGEPEPEPVAAQNGIASSDQLPVVHGVGVSSGLVEGSARVVDDPSFGDVEADEILVAPTTDPSWSSIMFVSAALVVDIGGPLSHAAVVARELGIPCVVGAGNATTVIKTGDHVRVDGDTGAVTVLARE